MNNIFIDVKFLRKEVVLKLLDAYGGLLRVPLNYD